MNSVQPIPLRSLPRRIRRTQRGSTATTVLLALAVAGAGMLAWYRPWSTSPATEARLRQRLAEYEQARRDRDVERLHALAAPSDTAVVSPDAFRTFYGQEMTRFHGLTVQALHIDGNRATTDVAIDFELVPEHMPATYRRNLQTADGAALRQHGNISLEWLFEAGDWHFRVDRVVLTGRDPQGRKASATQEKR